MSSTSNKTLVGWIIVGILEFLDHDHPEVITSITWARSDCTITGFVDGD